MRASVILDKTTSNYEIMPLVVVNSSDEEDLEQKLLLLHKSTETGDPFIVVAGYFLKQAGEFEQNTMMLAEIETVPVEDYARLKILIREKLGPESSKVPITFW